MRLKRVVNGLTVNAIAGTHVVTLGFDLTDAARKNCLGFAIQREDHTENESYWMSGMKVFEKTDPSLGLGGQVSSRAHPFQSFQWADYSAKPSHDYTYRVIALYGEPESLTEGATVSMPISTESELGETHAVFFNRGAVASQEYARRFQNQAPDKVGEAAYRWLSRGLLEAFVAFVGRAKGKAFSLHGAIYEFQWTAALAAFKAAAKSGAKVKVIYDAIPGKTGPKAKNKAAIDGLSMNTLCKPRTTGKIMHNKFVVLRKNDKPISVWLGSTNLTENGIFGHLNCGHIIEDPKVAAAYDEYWSEIAGNPAAKDEKAWMADENPAPPDPWSDDLVHVFSPRTGLDVLEWYAKVADGAQAGLFMTFAFGMHKDFQRVYEQNDGVLRMALMEKEGNGAALAQGKLDIARIRKLPNVVVAVANSIQTNSFDRWLQERNKLTKEANVKFVHTKFMLVDPLGDAPIVVTGSANFSAASTNSNEENMMVIRNSTRIADIYLGEFMRSFSHYSFREAVAIARRKGEKDWRPQYLIPDASWQRDYFKKGSARWLRRRYFAGT
jgi:hypothetical protein